MNLSKTVMLTMSAALLAACQTTTGQDAAYSANQLNRAMSATSCTVSSVRVVTVKDDSNVTTSKIVGGAAGGVLGRALGKTIGGGSGNDLARDLGTIGGVVAGAMAGSAYDASSSNTQALEYTVNTATGTTVVIQSVSEGEKVLQAGSRCNVITGDGSARIAPV